MMFMSKRNIINVRRPTNDFLQKQRPQQQHDSPLDDFATRSPVLEFWCDCRQILYEVLYFQVHVSQG